MINPRNHVIFPAVRSMYIGITAYGTNWPMKETIRVESTKGSQKPGLKMWPSTRGRASEMAQDVMMRDARSQLGCCRIFKILPAYSLSSISMSLNLLQDGRAPPKEKSCPCTYLCSWVPVCTQIWRRRSSTLITPIVNAETTVVNMTSSIAKPYMEACRAP